MLIKSVLSVVTVEPQLVRTLMRHPCSDQFNWYQPSPASPAQPSLVIMSSDYLYRPFVSERRDYNYTDHWPGRASKYLCEGTLYSSGSLHRDTKTGPAALL